MKLEGMIINFLGDSITEGVGTTAPENIFHQVIKKKYGLNHAYNHGISGTRIARQVVPTKDWPKHDLTFEIRSEIMVRSADAVVVFGGTNDYGHGDAPLGTLGSEDIYTFYGAVNSLISRLKRDLPNAKIVFMTPLHRVAENEPSQPDGKILEDYANAIRETCKMRDIPVIDLFEINPLNPTDPDVMPDGLHPNDKGHEIMAQVVAEELLKI